ncbi:MAG: zinc ribbon domain-containing protein [Tyzzerella sp.]|nr:zinc ribbon domain-containing protein [Tyzzerella sp.]
MASFLKDLGKIISEKAEVVAKKTGEVADVVVKKTEQTVEVQKIKNQIYVMQRNNDRDYRDIGKMVYDKFKNGEGADAEYIELCDAIAEREVAIAKAKEEMAKVKGLDVCPECASHIEPDAVFCPKCGAKVEDCDCEEDVEVVFEEE